MSNEKMKNNSKIYLGNILKTARIKKGISRIELSEVTGVIAPYIARIENNLLLNPGIRTVVTICKALDLSDSEILLIINSLDI